MNKKKDYSLVFQNSESFKAGNNKHLIVATGCHNSLSYFDTKILITDRMNGANALENIGSKHYLIDSNLDKNSTDSMYWKQYNISAKRFINDIWLATYIPESFPAVAITSQGKMLIRDIKKVIKRPDVDWNLADPGAGEKYIPIAPDYKLGSKKGFFNTWVGVGREKFLYDQDDAVGILLAEDIKAFFALTAKLGVNADREKKNFENGTVNENVHPNYWQAYLRNITSLASYSAISLKFNYQNLHLPVNLYDTLFFKEFSTTGKNASEYATGNYIITKIVERIQKRNLITLIEANRESFNQPFGNLR